MTVNRRREPPSLLALGRRARGARRALRRTPAGWPVGQVDAALLQRGTHLREPGAVGGALAGPRRRLPVGRPPVAGASAGGKGHALLLDAGTGAGAEGRKRAALRPPLLLGLLGRGARG